MYKSELVSAKKLTEKKMEELYQLQNCINKKYSFFISASDVEDKNKYLDYLNRIEKNKIKLYVVTNCSGTDIAFITLQKGTDWGGSDELKIEVTTSLDHEDHQFNSFLTDFIKQLKTEENNSVLITNNGEFVAVAADFDGRIKENYNKYLLTREGLNIELYQDWIKEAENINPDLSIRCYNGVPDEKLEEYCDLFNETMKDMPDCKEEGFVAYVARPEVLKVKDWTGRIGHYWFAVYNEKEEMVAKSNVAVYNPLSYQFMIGVKREYRGRKIGKWLYGSIYKKLEQLAEFKNIHVDHHPLNKSAIKISMDTGYKFKYNIKKIML